MSSLSKLGSHTLIYGGGRFLSKGLGFLLLPVYTRYLTSADYGIVSLLLITSGVAATAAQLGLGSAVFREVIYRKSDPDKAEGTALWSLLLAGSILFGLLMMTAGPLSQAIFDTDEMTRLLRLVFLTGWLDLSSVIFLASLRMRDRPVLYGILTLARFLTEIVLNILYVAVWERGVEGLILAGLWSTGIFGLAYLAWFFRRGLPGFDTGMLKRMLRFGLPLIPANLAAMVLTSSDRYFLQHFSGAQEVGLYSVGYMIGQITGLAVQAVHLAWPAHMFAVAKEPDGKQRLAQTLTWYVAAMGALVLGSSVLAPELLFLLTTPEFYAAWTVVPLIALGNMFYGMRYITNSGLATKNKMGSLPFITAGAAGLNLLLNAWWIPTQGMMGAARATLVSYLALFAVQLTLNLKVWYIAYEYRRLAWLFLSGIAWYFACTLITHENMWLNLALKLLILALWPLHLWLLGFPIESERRALRKKN